MAACAADCVNPSGPILRAAASVSSPAPPRIAAQPDNNDNRSKLDFVMTVLLFDRRLMFGGSRRFGANWRAGLPLPMRSSSHKNVDEAKAAGPMSSRRVAAGHGCRKNDRPRARAWTDGLRSVIRFQETHRSERAKCTKPLPTSCCPRRSSVRCRGPTWYNAVLGNKSFLEAMVNSRYREQYEDAVSCFLRAQEAGGPRHRHRRRRALRRGSRRHELAELSADPHGRLRPDRRTADLQGRGGAVPARPHPARFPRGARVPEDRRPGRPRPAAIHADVEDRAEDDQAAGQVRHHPARADRGLGRRTTTTRTRSSAPTRSATRSTRSSTSSPMPAVRCCRWKSRRSTWCRRAARPSASSA